MKDMTIAPHTALNDLVVRRLAEAGFEFYTALCGPRLLRGFTPKGEYNFHIKECGIEIRTVFLGRGENPLTNTEFLARTAGAWDGEAIARHVEAVLRNEMQFPWVLKETALPDGDETVRVLPFGEDRTAPQLVVRKQAASGKVSMEVLNSRSMSPAEAVLIAKALTRAAAIATESAMEAETAVAHAA